jgi:hypothetical protein
MLPVSEKGDSPVQMSGQYMHYWTKWIKGNDQMLN